MFTTYTVRGVENENFDLTSRKLSNEEFQSGFSSKSSS